MYVKEGRAAQQHEHLACTDGKSATEEHLQEAEGQTLLRGGADGGVQGQQVQQEPFKESRLAQYNITTHARAQTDIWTYKNTRNSR